MNELKDLNYHFVIGIPKSGMSFQVVFNACRSTGKNIHPEYVEYLLVSRIIKKEVEKVIDEKWRLNNGRNKD